MSETTKEAKNDINQRAQDELKTLTRLLEAPPYEIRIPGVSAKFDSRLSIKKAGVHVCLVFPLRDKVHVNSINRAMRMLVNHASQGEVYAPNRSLLLGHDASINRQDYEEPTRWCSDLRRVPGTLYACIASDSAKEQHFKKGQMPMLPGEFSSFWPWPSSEAGATLPAPLHPCRKLFLDFVEEKNTTMSNCSETGKRTYLRATFVLELNVRYALLNKNPLRYAYMSPQHIVESLFSSSRGGEPTGQRTMDPSPLTTNEVALGLRRIIDDTMSLYYADLRRDLALVSEMPLRSNPPASWQSALRVARLSSLELHNRVHADNPRKAFCELKSQMLAWRKEESFYRGATPKGHKGREWGDLSESAGVFSMILQSAKNGSAVPDVELYVECAGDKKLDLSLLLNGHNGICHSMPRGYRSENARIAGKVYPLPGRTNVSTSLDGLVNICLMSTYFAFESFRRFDHAMPSAPAPDAVRTECAIFDILVRPCSTRDELSARQALFASLRDGTPIPDIFRVQGYSYYSPGWIDTVLRAKTAGVHFRSESNGTLVAFTR